ncbi:MAG: hypothetical protein KC680_01675, partial [Candidatus Peregrinibacteria bacterium]|nr:hypothetical protein [Candidatus Peregrinibacteria bacterium]
MPDLSSIEHHINQAIELASLPTAAAREQWQQLLESIQLENVDTFVDGIKEKFEDLKQSEKAHVQKNLEALCAGVTSTITERKLDALKQWVEEQRPLVDAATEAVIEHPVIERVKNFVIEAGDAICPETWNPKTKVAVTLATGAIAIYAGYKLIEWMSKNVKNAVIGGGVLLVGSLGIPKIMDIVKQYKEVGNIKDAIAASHEKSKKYADEKLKQAQELYEKGKEVVKGGEANEHVEILENEGWAVVAKGLLFLHSDIAAALSIDQDAEKEAVVSALTTIPSDTPLQQFLTTHNTIDAQRNFSIPAISAPAYLFICRVVQAHEQRLQSFWKKEGKVWDPMKVTLSDFVSRIGEAPRMLSRVTDALRGKDLSEMSVSDMLKGFFGDEEHNENSPGLNIVTNPTLMERFYALAPELRSSTEAEQKQHVMEFASFVAKVRRKTLSDYELLYKESTDPRARAVLQAIEEVRTEKMRKYFSLYTHGRDEFTEALYAQLDNILVGDALQLFSYAHMTHGELPATIDTSIMTSGDAMHSVLLQLKILRLVGKQDEDLGRHFRYALLFNISNPDFNLPPEAKEILVNMGNFVQEQAFDAAIGIYERTAGEAVAGTSEWVKAHPKSSIGIAVGGGSTLAAELFNAWRGRHLHDVARLTERSMKRYGIFTDTALTQVVNNAKEYQMNKKLFSPTAWKRLPGLSQYYSNYYIARHRSIVLQSIASADSKNLLKSITTKGRNAHVTQSVVDAMQKIAEAGLTHSYGDLPRGAGKQSIVKKLKAHFGSDLPLKKQITNLFTGMEDLDVAKVNKSIDVLDEIYGNRFPSIADLKFLGIPQDEIEAMVKCFKEANLGAFKNAMRPTGSISTHGFSETAENAAESLNRLNKKYSNVVDVLQNKSRNFDITLESHDQFARRIAESDFTDELLELLERENIPDFINHPEYLDSLLDDVIHDASSTALEEAAEEVVEEATLTAASETTDRATEKVAKTVTESAESAHEGTDVMRKYNTLKEAGDTKSLREFLDGDELKALAKAGNEEAVELVSAARKARRLKMAGSAATIGLGVAVDAVLYHQNNVALSEALEQGRMAEVAVRQERRKSLGLSGLGGAGLEGLLAAGQIGAGASIALAAPIVGASIYSEAIYDDVLTWEKSADQLADKNSAELLEEIQDLMTRRTRATAANNGMTGFGALGHWVKGIWNPEKYHQENQERFDETEKTINRPQRARLYAAYFLKQTHVPLTSDQIHRAEVDPQGFRNEYLAMQNAAVQPKIRYLNMVTHGAFDAVQPEMLSKANAFAALTEMQRSGQKSLVYIDAGGKPQSLDLSCFAISGVPQDEETRMKIRETVSLYHDSILPMQRFTAYAINAVEILDSTVEGSRERKQQQAQLSAQIAAEVLTEIAPNIARAEQRLREDGVAGDYVKRDIARLTLRERFQKELSLYAEQLSMQEMSYAEYDKTLKTLKSMWDSSTIDALYAASTSAVKTAYELP